MNLILKTLGYSRLQILNPTGVLPHLTNKEAYV
jgi:hypothetical protein